MDRVRMLRLDSMSSSFPAVSELHPFCSIWYKRRLVLTYICNSVQLQIFLPNTARGVLALWQLWQFATLWRAILLPWRAKRERKKEREERKKKESKSERLHSDTTSCSLFCLFTFLFCYFFYVQPFDGIHVFSLPMIFSDV